MAQIINGNFAGTGSIVPGGGGLGMQVDPKNPTQLVKTPSTGLDTYTGAPLTPKATEPAVVSSTGADKQIQDAKDKMAQMSDKGTKVDVKSGATVYADGATAPAVEGATYNTKTGQYEPADPTSGDYKSFYGDENTAPSPEYAAIEKQFAPLKASLDAGTLAQVNSIESQYNTLKDLQQQVNTSSTNTVEASTIDKGEARYTPQAAHAITLAAISTGVSKISDLDAKESAAIAKANNAATSGDSKLMTEMMKEAETIRKDKQTQADKVLTTIQKANDALSKERDQIQKDSAVQKLMSEGETDPGKILNAINEGGLSMTADEVKKAMTALTPSSTASDTYKFTQSNVGKLLAAGMTKDQIQQVQDYYNKKGDAPELSAGQTAAVQQVLSGITPKATKTGPAPKPILDGTLTYTPEDHASDQKALDSSRGSDGFVDPTMYHKLYTAWIGKGGTVEGFVKTYPPKNYINPANDWLPTYLRPKAPAASGITPAEIDALFPKK